MFKIEEVIDLAVQIEKNGESVYRDGLRLGGVPSMDVILRKLADDEAQHVEWFVHLRQKVQKSAMDPQLEEMGKEILLNVLGDQAFTLKEVDFSRIRHIGKLLEIAVEFERDTILFYEMLRPLVQDEDLNHLEKIIAEEKNHVRLIQEMIGPDGVIP